MNRGVSSQAVLDRLGGCVSTACAVHCAVEPILIVLHSIASIEFLFGGTFERIILTGGLCLATVSVVYGLRQHGNPRIFLPFITGVFLIALGEIGFASPLQTVFIVPGGLAIAGTHLLNIRYRRDIEQRKECERKPSSVRPETC
jgi:hypothetical protein